VLVEKPPKDVEKPVTEHLMELLVRLRIALIAIIIASAVAAFFPINIIPLPLQSDTVNSTLIVRTQNSTDIISQLLESMGVGKGFEYRPLVIYVMDKMRSDILSFQNSTLGRFFGVDKVKVLIIAHGITSTISVMLKLALLLGLTLASPIVAYEIYKYVEPALYPHEQKFLYSFVISFTVLFIFGLYYSYTFIVPLTFLIFLWLNAAPGIAAVFSVEEFYDFILLGLFGVGIFFTLPVIIVLLVKFDVITPNVLTKRWRESVLAITVLTAILTPDPTPVTTLLLLLPILTLYAISVGAAKIAYRRKKASS